MRSFFLTLFLIIIAAAAAAPYLDGLYFKREYLMLVSQMNKMDLHPSIDSQTIIENYHVGWLTSTADLKTIVTSNDPNLSSLGKQVIEVKSKLVVHHGPVIYENNKIRFAFAELEQDIFLPSVLKGFLTETDKGFVQVTGSLNFSTHAWNSTITIPPMSFGQWAKWDGINMTGDIMVGASGIHSMQSSGTIGRFEANLPMIPAAITINPISVASTMSLANNTPTNVNMKITSAGASINTNGKTVFSMNGAALDESLSTTNNGYSFMIGSNISGLAIEGAGKFSSIPEIKYSLSFANIDKAAVAQLQQLLHSFNGNKPSNEMIAQMKDAYLNLVTNGSKIDLSFSGMTSLGGGATNLSVTFVQKPKNLQEIFSVINFKADLKIARMLLTEVLSQGLNYNLTEKYHKALKEPTADGSPANFQAITAEYDAAIASLPQQTSALIDQLIKQGFLLQEGDSVSFSTSKNGDVITYNGVTDSPITGIIKQIVTTPAVTSQLVH